MNNLCTPIYDHVSVLSFAAAAFFIFYQSILLQFTFTVYEF
jgi:hypothetical protein